MSSVIVFPSRFVFQVTVEAVFEDQVAFRSAAPLAEGNLVELVFTPGVRRAVRVLFARGGAYAGRMEGAVDADDWPHPLAESVGRLMRLR